MRALLVLALLACTALAGCTDGGSDGEVPRAEPTDAPVDGTPGSNTGTATTNPNEPKAVAISIEATGVYPFNPALTPARFEVEAGSMLTITYTNEDGNPFINHDLFVSGVDEQTASLANGESAELTFLVDLEPGEYAFWCAVGNHRDQGMEGVMVVV